MMLLPTLDGSPKTPALVYPTVTPWPILALILTMTANHDRDHDDAGSPLSRSTRPRFYQENNDVQHNDPRNSPSLSPSSEYADSGDSAYSDEHLIVDAIRVPTPEQRSQNGDHFDQASPDVEEGLAANLAMLIPTGYSYDGHSSMDSTFPRRTARHPSHRTRPRNQFLSDQGSPRVPHSFPSHLNEVVSSDDDTHCELRKTVSLGAGDGDGPVPRWSASAIPAVRTAQPPYPPPERQPTPPGLPSFNTPEAVYYSAQFLAGTNPGASSTPNSAHGTPAGSPRSPSYGDAIRRFFGLSPPVDPVSSSLAGIGRASDGTVVQGRFPYRQSGHGMNLARQLEDHPFHQTNLPVARVESERAEDENTEASATKGASTWSRRRAQIYAPPAIGRLWSSSSSPRSSTPPDSGPSVHMWRPVTPRSLFRVSRSQSPHDRLPTAPPPSPASPSPASPSSASQADSFAQVLGLTESQSNPSPLRTTTTQTGDEETVGDGEISTEGCCILDIILFLPIQMYNCCCQGRLNSADNTEDLQPLDVTSSRDTYMTAPSRPSYTQPEESNENSRGGRQGMQSWISSVYYSICSRAPDSASSP